MEFFENGMNQPKKRKGRCFAAGCCIKTIAFALGKLHSKKPSNSGVKAESAEVSFCAKMFVKPRISA